jgi:hypothetical protein
VSAVDHEVMTRRSRCSRGNRESMESPWRGPRDSIQSNQVHAGTPLAESDLECRQNPRSPSLLSPIESVWKDAVRGPLIDSPWFSIDSVLTLYGDSLLTLSVDSPLAVDALQTTSGQSWLWKSFVGIILVMAETRSACFGPTITCPKSGHHPKNIGCGELRGIWNVSSLALVPSGRAF